MELADKINAILDALAERFGSTAAELWAILIRQQVIKGVTGLIWIAFGVVALVIVAKLVRFAAKMANEKGLDDVLYNNPFLIMGIILGTIFGLCLIALNVSGVVTAFANPQYAALRDVMVLIGK